MPQLQRERDRVRDGERERDREKERERERDRCATLPPLDEMVLHMCPHTTVYMCLLILYYTTGQVHCD
jgi:hypothetical protein